MKCKGIAHLPSLLLAVMLIFLNVLPPGVQAGEPALQGGLVVEDFQNYDGLETLSGVEWDIWQHQLSLDKINDEPVSLPNSLLLPSGEAFVVWTESHYRSKIIFAQKLDARGNRLWQQNVQVNDPQHIFIESINNLLPGTEGSLYLIFCDTTGCYLQRISANGERLWPQDVLIRPNPSGPSSVSSVITPAGEIAISWATGISVIVEKFDANGQKVWSVTAGESEIDEPRAPPITGLSVDPTGRLMVAWRQFASPGIMVQQLDPSGNVVWPAPAAVGEMLDTDYRFFPVICVSASLDGAYIAWSGTGSGGDIQVQAQRISPTGKVLWPVPALLKREIHPQSGLELKTLVDKNGDLLAWWRYQQPETNNVYWQKVRSNGSLVFAAEQPLLSPSPSTREILVSGAFNADDAALATNLQPGKISAQPFSSSGEALIARPVAVNAHSGKTYATELRLAAGPDGDTWALWLDRRLGEDQQRVYIQRFDESGRRQFATETVVDTGSGGDRTAYRILIATDPQKNGLVAWEYWKDEHWEVRVQKLRPDGSWLWPSYQTVRSATSDDVTLNAIETDSSGMIYILWGRGGRLNLQKLDPNGQRLWGNGKPAHIIDQPPRSLSVKNDYGALDIGPDGALHVAWVQDIHWGDEKDPDYRVKVQRLNASGELLWPANIWAIDAVATMFNFGSLHIGADPNGNSSVVWHTRHVIAFQKLSPSGESLGDEKHVRSEEFDFDLDAGASDMEPQGSATYVVWPKPTGGGVGVRRIDAEGSYTWPNAVNANSLPAGPDERYQSLAVAAGDTSASVGWRRYSPGTRHDFAINRVSASGERLWAEDQPVIGVNQFYLPSGFVQSRRLNTGSRAILSARLDADISLNNGSLCFYLSNNGGKDWQAVTPGTTHTFTTSGADLRWGVEIQRSADLRQTPLVHRVSVTYTSGSFVQGMQIFLPIIVR